MKDINVLFRDTRLMHIARACFPERLTAFIGVLGLRREDHKISSHSDRIVCCQILSKDVNLRRITHLAIHCRQLRMSLAS